MLFPCTPVSVTPRSIFSKAKAISNTRNLNVQKYPVPQQRLSC